MNTLDRYNNLIFAYQYEYSEGNNSNHGDIEYYIEKLSSLGTRVLELACGTGRITIPLKKAGIDVVGLDHAEAMIKIAKDKALKEDITLQWKVGDATTFNDSIKYGAIFIPYNAISFIENDKLELFAINIKKNLTTRGRFLFDLSRSTYEMYDQNKKRYVDWSKEIFIEELKIHLRRKMEMTLFSEKKIVESIYYWEIRDSTGKLSNKATKMHFSTLDTEKYIEVLEKQGFRLVDIKDCKFEKHGLKRIHSFVEMAIT